MPLRKLSRPVYEALDKSTPLHICQRYPVRKHIGARTIRGACRVLDDVGTGHDVSDGHTGVTHFISRATTRQPKDECRIGPNNYIDSWFVHPHTVRQRICGRVSTELRAPLSQSSRSIWRDMTDCSRDDVSPLALLAAENEHAKAESDNTETEKYHAQSNKAANDGRCQHRRSGSNSRRRFVEARSIVSSACRRRRGQCERVLQWNKRFAVQLRKVQSGSKQVSALTSGNPSKNTAAEALFAAGKRALIRCVTLTRASGTRTESKEAAMTSTVERGDVPIP